jgi:hypothetical protein
MAMREHAARAGARRRTLESLRDFKRVINALGGTAIVLTPVIGVLLESGAAALFTAGSFFALMWVLEAFECRRKREFEALS